MSKYNWIKQVCGAQWQVLCIFLEAGDRRTQAAAADTSETQKVEQYANANRATLAIVTPKSEDVFHSLLIYLPLSSIPHSNCTSMYG